MKIAVGFDVGGTNIKAVAMEPSGRVVMERLRPSPHDPSIVQQVREHLTALEKELGRPADAVGIAAPGLAAKDERCIAALPASKLAIEGVDWTKGLNRTTFVPVLNDAHAALLGEVWIGAAKNIRDAVLLTLGTGVGGAILSGGKLLKGHIGRGGHLGHTCLDPDGPPDLVGTPGSLEYAIGNVSLPQRSNGRFTSTRLLVEAHRAGDADASRIWSRSIYVFACGIASIINAVDPELIILGGGIALAGDDLFKPLADYLDRLEWRPNAARVKIVPAALGDNAGAIGAAHHALTTEKN